MDFREIVLNIAKFINGTVIPLFVAAAFMYFVWNIIFYIRNMSNEKEREQFKKYSVNAVLILFIMVSIWGVLGIFTGVFLGSKPFVPQLPTGDGTQQNQNNSVF